MSPFQAGNRYKFINVKAGTAIDLSGYDNSSIIGYAEHDGANQRWIAEQSNSNHWSFRNESHQDKFLGFSSEPADGTPILATNEPFYWEIKHDEDGAIRLFVPGTPFNVDLSDHGNKADGTPVTLWGTWKGKNQLWHIQQV